MRAEMELEKSSGKSTVSAVVAVARKFDDPSGVDQNVVILSESNAGEKEFTLVGTSVVPGVSPVTGVVAGLQGSFAGQLLKHAISVPDETISWQSEQAAKLLPMKKTAPEMVRIPKLGVSDDTTKSGIEKTSDTSSSVIISTAANRVSSLSISEERREVETFRVLLTISIPDMPGNEGSHRSVLGSE
ncbi:hypothetical protein NE237_028786 [Protea cynaroides]|uniref:Uncharacterized protein n=1 Tax=Protea cynaroides TaxID=273540 RepID=A0A9Q0GUH9_9MAGN|nr:hypothetical protein NE237_028786 [Protea cynaroides]